MKFRAPRTIRFADCDPAGIVFFPHYLVMLNTFVEQWFDEGLKIPYAKLIAVRRTGLPTVRLEVDFTAISRHGELVEFSVEVDKLGRSSMSLQLQCHGGAEQRFRARQVLVCTHLETHRPQPWPDDIRAALLPYLAPEASS